MCQMWGIGQGDGLLMLRARGISSWQITTCGGWCVSISLSLKTLSSHVSFKFRAHRSFSSKLSIVSWGWSIMADTHDLYEAHLCTQRPWKNEFRKDAGAQGRRLGVERMTGFEAGGSTFLWPCYYSQATNCLPVSFPTCKMRLITTS